MRFLSVALILVLIASFVVAFAGVPVFHIENTRRDAGKVTQGEIIQQVFTFVNKGTSTLEIVNVGHS